MIDALSSFLKIGIGAEFVIRQKLLRIAGDQWEPGALDLHHDAMAFLECVHDAGHDVENLCRHVWS